MMSWAENLYQAFFGSDVMVSPFYLLGFVAVALVVYLYRQEKTGFIAWLLPRRIWTHKSTRLDIILFVMGRLMAAFGLLSRFAVTPIVAAWVASILPWESLVTVNTSPVLLAFLFWAGNDFAVYWVHRLHHENRTLWPLHAVHHAAEVMTPITAYRQHPLGVLVFAVFQTAIMGAVLGILVGSLNSGLTLAEIAGINAFSVIAILGMANFHHSHIWISYGPVLERIFISPAQHQIHHSTEPRHFNRNYGGFLALWDWMFGTLYVIRKNEVITLGLNGKADASLMTHRLDKTLIDPLRRMIFPAR